MASAQPFTEDPVIQAPGPSRVLIAQEARYGAHAGHALDVVCTRGEGVHLLDVEGRRYMDFLAADSGANQGHNHPRIARAIVEQIKRLAFTSHAFRNDQLPLFLEKLCRLSGFEKALLANSTAEAVDMAFQAMRTWAYDVKRVPRPEAEILVARGGARDAGQGIRAVPFGDLDAVQAAITAHTAGIFMEPVQGRAAVRVPPKGFLQGLRELADRHRILFVLDETQSGFGRTGEMFAFEHERIRPDGMLVGRALSGGCFPVSALLGRRELMDGVAPGLCGATGGGTPLACAVATAAIDLMEEEDLVARASALGRHLQARLEALRSDRIRELRCPGLWAGLELEGGADGCCLALQARGLLCRAVQDRTICLAPPLVVTREELDWAVDQIEAVLA